VGAGAPMVAIELCAETHIRVNIGLVRQALPSCIDMRDPCANWSLAGKVEEEPHSPRWRGM